MASVKVKFRPSTIEGKEGTVYYQIIQNRVIRQLKTDYLYHCRQFRTKQSASFLAGTHGVGPETVGYDYPPTG